ncbi:hypothetical protein [Cryobacterium sp. Y57]|uniref:hypothetical protein n=1 Tax=Cryobacterium sp. Y57 TaxID=2048287 RepID=UPI0011B0A1E0|nr:hypothetical protein [Cryobacterium sp. Y57]
MRATGSAPTVTVELRRATTPRLLWGLAGLAVALSTVARLPAISAGVEEEVLTGPMSELVGELPDADLAVAIGTMTGLVLSIALKLLVVAGAMAVEHRTRRAGHVIVGGRYLSLTFLVVTGTLLAVQLVSLALGLQSSGVKPWSLILGAGLAVVGTFVVRDARWSVFPRLALAMLLTGVCLAV